MVPWITGATIGKLQMATIGRWSFHNEPVISRGFPADLPFISWEMNYIWNSTVAVADVAMGVADV